MSNPEAKETKDARNHEPQPAQAPLAEQLAAARMEAADNHDRYLRTAADLENFRRRMVREKEELRLFATSRLLEDLLPALDNLALGLASARQPKADLKGILGGMELLQQQLKAALAAHGLREIDPDGKPFDPHQHEAISHEPSPDVAAEHVLKVVRTGYVLNGRLLRPASVIVSSGKPVEEKAG
ncbi:MAG TPA: nucleotide exchange factor GrpE [Opitutaceae bacterium]|nr:nucleotide exchange factor GrpE [Opitutaceae bacterium]